MWRSLVDRERLALALLLLLMVGLSLSLALPTFFPPEWTADGRRVIELVAHAPEAGGWSGEEIVVQAGEPVRLRLRSEDVVHGFALAHLEIGVERIEPGKVVELDLTVEQPGRYRFYCDVWCGPQHYRMRGTLVVLGPDGEAPEPPVPAVDPSVDPDAPHRAESLPPRPPSPERGAGPAHTLTEGLLAEGDLFAESPEVLYLRLRGQGLGEEEAWDALAYLWQQRLDAEWWAWSRRFYARNCAACHGAGGDGNGPAAVTLPDPPADFTIAAGATDAIWRAKIVRGGMGTGMPYWGRLLGEEEIQALIRYLRGFLLNPAAMP